MRISLCLTCLLTLAGCVERETGNEESKRTDGLPPSGTAECRRAKGSIKIDGIADEEAWKEAQEITSFDVHWQRRKPKWRARKPLLALCRATSGKLLCQRASHCPKRYASSKILRETRQMIDRRLSATFPEPDSED